MSIQSKLILISALSLGLSITAAQAQDRQTAKPNSETRAETPEKDIKAPETPQENAAVFVKIKGVKGEAENHSEETQTRAATGDANLDGRVDANDLMEASTDESSGTVKAPEPGPQKTSFSILLSGGSGDDAPSKPDKPEEGDD